MHTYTHAQGNRDAMFLPKAISALSHVNVTAVACGGAHTLCLTKDNKLFAFGRGRNGQLGRADKLESVAAYRMLPLEVEFFAKEKLIVSRMACGIDHSAVLAGR
jgi:alpha-tubulin suppressor-like RCC1 family protein